MPKTGMLVRISLVLAAAAALATIAVSAAGAARQSVTLRARAAPSSQPPHCHVDLASRLGGSPFTSAKGIAVTYGGGGSGAGVADITNNTVDFGASDAPLSAFASDVHDVRTRSRGRSPAPQSSTGSTAVTTILKMTGAGAREDLPRPDHLLGRPGDQGSQQGVTHPAHGDHDRAPRFVVGHDVQLHRLPLERFARPSRPCRRRHASRDWPGSNTVAGARLAAVSMRR